MYNTFNEHVPEYFHLHSSKDNRLEMDLIQFDLQYVVDIIC